MAIQIISGEVYSDMLAEAEAIPGVKRVIWYLSQVIVMTGADIPVTPIDLVTPIDPVTPIELTLPN